MKLCTQQNINLTKSFVLNDNSETKKILDIIEEKNFDYKSVNIVLNAIHEKYGFETNKICEQIFSKPTKKLRKLTNQIFSSENPDISVLNLIKILSINIKVNNDIIVKYYSPSVYRSKGINRLTIDFVKKIKKLYGDDRTTKLLLNDNFSSLGDIIYMINDIESKRELDFLPKKPKSLKEIHDSLSRMYLKLEIPDYNLEQREDILILDNKKIDDNMIIRVPKTHYDLIDLGEDLSFCIGNGDYSREVKEGRCSIVSIYKDNKPLYGIQFTRYAINQAYGFDNEEIPNSILLKLQDALISEPKVPKDFIAIEDSNWINGFKYNNKDLYIMMNNQIYVYFDVEESVYEELIYSERKGTFVNQIIKPNYAYEKIN